MISFTFLSICIAHSNFDEEFGERIHAVVVNALCLNRSAHKTKRFVIFVRQALSNETASGCVAYQSAFTDKSDRVLSRLPAELTHLQALDYFLHTDYDRTHTECSLNGLKFRKKFFLRNLQNFLSYVFPLTLLSYVGGFVL